MDNYRGLYLPNGESHLTHWMDVDGHTRDGKPTYQYKKYQAALAHVKTRGRALDIGAHVGLWSRVMALDFDEVLAFEPVPAHIECWKANMKHASNARLYETALGRRAGVVQMHQPELGSSGGARVAYPGDIPNAAQSVDMQLLDDYLLDYIDFLKIDNEGYEYYVLRGAIATLKRCKPVIIVEQKPGMAQRFGLEETEAVSFLKGLGATLHQEIQGDYILSWN